MNDTIQIVFFNLRFRLYVLRMIILSALVAALTSIPIAFTYDPSYPFGWTALPAFILVHHILVAGPPKFLLGILDLLLAIGESIATGFYVTKRRQDLSFKPWAPEVIIYHAASFYTLLACLSLFTIFRLANVVRSYEEILIRPLDMFEKLWPDKEDRPTISTLFVGRTFWKEHFTGESKIVRILRGLLGLGIIVILFLYAMLRLVYEPIKETSLTPLQEYRSTILPVDYDIDDILWNIVIGPIHVRDKGIQQDIIDSIMVSPLDTPVQAQAPDIAFMCHRFCPEPLSDDPYRFLITYQCNDTGPNNHSLQGVLITVNHTALPRRNHQVVQALNVVVGLFNQDTIGIDTLMAKSTSLNVVPGANLIAAISTNVREIFLQPGVAAFGLYQVTKSLWIATITSIYPDPSPDIIRDPAVSTLRLYIEDPDPTELIILSDQRDNSVLAGFSALGGLWTSLCGLFVLMFGGSMLHYLYGSKDISVVGAAHSFNHTRLREAFQRDYPDIGNIEDNHGILALLSDHIIDLDFLKNRSSSSTDPDVEKGHTGTDSFNLEAKIRKSRSDATEHSESDTAEKHSFLVDSQFAPTSVYAYDASNTILRPLRRQPSV